MGSKFLIIGFVIVLSGCASQRSNNNLALVEQPSLEWPQDYKNLGAPEDFIPSEKPAFLKDCITDSVIFEKGLRYIAFPGTYEAVDEWSRAGNHSPKYSRKWIIVKPARTIEIVLGSAEDSLKIPEKDLCQEK